ncbi:MAG: hypothetical protein ACM3UZ_16425 [Acidobacteriota bacterium]
MPRVKIQDIKPEARDLDMKEMKNLFGGSIAPTTGITNATSSQGKICNDAGTIVATNQDPGGAMGQVSEKKICMKTNGLSY